MIKHSLKVDLKGYRLRFGWIARFCEAREVELGYGGFCSPHGSNRCWIDANKLEVNNERHV